LLRLVLIGVISPISPQLAFFGRIPDPTASERCSSPLAQFARLQPAAAPQEMSDANTFTISALGRGGNLDS
jgi:hypothetical protein